MDQILSRLVGTLRSFFRIGPATLVTPASPVPRTYTLPASSGTVALVPPNVGPVLSTGTEIATVAWLEATYNADSRGETRFGVAAYPNYADTETKAFFECTPNDARVSFYVPDWSGYLHLTADDTPFFAFSLPRVYVTDFSDNLFEMWHAANLPALRIALANEIQPIGGTTRFVFRHPSDDTKSISLELPSGGGKLEVYEDPDGTPVLLGEVPGTGGGDVSEPLHHNRTDLIATDAESGIITSQDIYENSVQVFKNGALLFSDEYSVHGLRAIYLSHDTAPGDKYSVSFWSQATILVDSFWAYGALVLSAPWHVPPGDEADLNLIEPWQ